MIRVTQEVPPPTFHPVTITLTKAEDVIALRFALMLASKPHAQVVLSDILQQAAACVGKATVTRVASELHERLGPGTINVECSK